MWFSEAGVEGWRAEARSGWGAQPKYSALAIATALTLRSVFSLALRQTEGLIGSILQLLGLDLAVPDHSTLSRRAEALEVARPRCGGKPVHLLVDSTGLRLCGPGGWLEEKHGTKRRRAWKVLHLTTDADTGEIVASVLTDRDADDGSQVGPLLDQVDGPVAALTGDGPYDRNDVYAEVGARHPEAAVIVPPRANAVPSAAAETARTRRDAHLRCIAKRGRMGWQRASGYGWRALVESDISHWSGSSAKGCASTQPGAKRPKW
ncbi:IS5 family transposase [Belnapia sp. T6]|uniref:IS5 family transposase n=1 Tax=Belnapia mucosa TaxID=2804532 RepID=A0ABS1VBT0_9PROT|nr:IS5 family transposase [Belnapia mucosa]MBL6459131.1 IS5 family transposase [Belnapia mucosa]